MADITRAIAPYTNCNVCNGAANINLAFEIPFAVGAGLGIIVPASSNLTSIAVYGAKLPGQTYVPVNVVNNDNSTAAVNIAVSNGNGYDVNLGTFAWGALKLVGNAAGVVDVVVKT